jgi:hypothetical protein
MDDLPGEPPVRPPIRLPGALHAALASPLAQTLATAALSRLLLIVLFILGRSFADPRDLHDLPLYSRSSLRAMLESATAYGDFGWYSQIAEAGYAREPFSIVAQKDWAFFPLQPLLIQMLPNAWEQFLFGQACFFVAVVLFARACASFLNRERMFLAGVLLCFSPYSISLSQFRPDSVLFLGFCATLYAAERRDLWLTAPALLVAGFAKPNGFLAVILALPGFGLPILGSRTEAMKRLRSGLALLGCALGGILFMSVLCSIDTGNALAWARIQVAWGNSLARPLKQIAGLIVDPMLVGRYGWDFDLFNWLVFAAAILSIVLLVRRHAYTLAAFGICYTGMTFLSSGNWAMMKHLAASPAVFAGLGLIDPRRHYALAALLLVLSGLLCGVVAVASGAGISAARM